MSEDDSSSEKGFTKEGLIRLERAIAKGVRRVKYTDKEVEFSTLSEMLKARDVMRSCLGLNRRKTNCGLFGGKRIVASHSKALTDCGAGDGEEHGERKDKDRY